MLITNSKRSNISGIGQTYRQIERVDNTYGRWLDIPGDVTAEFFRFGDNLRIPYQRKTAGRLTNEASILDIDRSSFHTHTSPSDDHMVWRKIGSK